MTCLHPEVLTATSNPCGLVRWGWTSLQIGLAYGPQDAKAARTGPHARLHTDPHQDGVGRVN